MTKEGLFELANLSKQQKKIEEQLKWKKTNIEQILNEQLAETLKLISKKLSKTTENFDKFSSPKTKNETPLYILSRDSQSQTLEDVILDRSVSDTLPKTNEATNFIILQEKSFSDFFWKGVEIRKLGGTTRVDNQESEWDITPEPQSVFSSTKKSPVGELGKESQVNFWNVLQSSKYTHCRPMKGKPSWGVIIVLFTNSIKT